MRLSGHGFVIPSLCLCLASSLALLPACNGDAPDPNTPPQPTATDATIATTPAPEPTPAPTPVATTPPPVANPAQLLAALQQTHTAGMKAEGSLISTQLSDGVPFDTPFQLMPQKCYTIIAAGAGMSELNVQLVGSLPPLPEQVIAQDNDTGPQAVLGPNGKCWTNIAPLQIPAKLRLVATGGSGQAVAQVYVK